MLNEKIKSIRKSYGLTQEEFALRLNVVRQTVSKWEQGISVPDAETVSRISELFNIPVQEILGSKPIEINSSDEIAKQLTKINEQLAIKNHRSANIWRIACIILAIVFAFSLGLVIKNNTSDSNISNILDEIAIIDVSFDVSQNNASTGTITCSFVPETYNKKIGYTLIVHNSNDYSNDLYIQTKEKNGVYTAEIEDVKMENLSYNTIDSFIVKANYKGATKNIIIAENFRYTSTGYSFAHPDL